MARSASFLYCRKTAVESLMYEVVNSRAMLRFWQR
jgi:hypothetical protein